MENDVKYREESLPARKIIVKAEILLKEGVVEEKSIKIGKFSDELVNCFNSHLKIFQDKIEKTSVTFSAIEDK